MTSLCRAVLPPPLARSLTTAPTAYPLTVAEAKTHLRITQSTQDAEVESFLAAATRAAERHCERAFMQQVWTVALDEFWGDADLELPYPPLVSIGSIKYDDADGVETTIATSVYEADIRYQPGRVRLKYGQSWPTPRAQQR